MSSDLPVRTQGSGLTMQPPSEPPESGETSKPPLRLSDSDVPRILEIVFKLSDTLNQYWSLFIITSGVVVGWRVSTQQPWGVEAKRFALLLYLAFVAVNGFCLFRMYYWLEQAVTDLKKAGDDLDDTKHGSMKSALKNVGIPGGRTLAYIVYVATIWLVVSSIGWVK